MTFTTRPTLEGTFGMVSSTHWLASQSAQRMLELGGNAFDAAAAGGFVLHVVEPHLNGPGGDLPAIVATAADPTPARAVRPGPGAGGSDARGVRRHGPRPRPRLGTAGRRRPGRGRRLAAPAARPRLAPAGDRPRAGDRLRPRRASAARPGGRDDRPGAGPVPRQLDDLGRPVAARRTGPARGRAVRQPGLRVGARAARRRGARPPAPTWPRRRRRPATPGAQGFVAEAVEAFRGTRLAALGRRGAARAGRRRRPRGVLGHLGGARRRRVARRPGREDRPLGPGAGAAAGAGDARRARTAGARPVHGARASTPSPSAGSWRWPTGRPGSATAARSRSTSCWLPTTWPTRAALVGAVADLGVRPGAPGGREPRLSPARAAAARRRGHRPRGRRDHRRADRAARRHRQRRHLPHRRRRPLGQHHLGDPERRLAAELADHPRAGLLPGQPGADVLARRGAAGLAGARRPPAYDAHPDPRPARRRAGPRLRLPRRRPAGPVAVAVPAAPRRRRDGASRRRSTPRCSTRTSFPGSFHPREMEPGVLVVEDRDPRRRARRRSSSAVTRSMSAGPWYARPDVRGRAATPRPACCEPARTRAACRGTPSGASSLRGSGRHHHRVEGERLGAVALDLERAGEHAAHRVQLTGRQPQEVGALDGDGRVAALSLGRAGLDRADPVGDVHDVAVDLAVGATADPEADRQLEVARLLGVDEVGEPAEHLLQHDRPEAALHHRAHVLARRRGHRGRDVDRVERARVDRGLAAAGDREDAADRERQHRVAVDGQVGAEVEQRRVGLPRHQPDEVDDVGGDGHVGVGVLVEGDRAGVEAGGVPLDVLLRPGELEAHHARDLGEPLRVGELGEAVEDRDHALGPEVVEVDQRRGARRRSPSGSPR